MRFNEAMNRERKLAEEAKVRQERKRTKQEIEEREIRREMNVHKKVKKLIR